MSRPLQDMADQVGDAGACEPTNVPEAGEVEDKYPVWVRLSILGGGVILSWTLIVLIVRAVMDG